MAKTRSELPSAAFKINGTFVEDSVSGYHTLNASGKWTLEKELITAETSVRTGSIFINSRYPARTIEIEYLIEGTSWDDLQTKYTSLMQILNEENAEIIFNGEPDKFIKGYFSIGSDIETTYTTRHGTFNIICVDPFKYSVTEYAATAVGGQFSVTYNGTYKGYPTFVTTFPSSPDASGDETSTSECGYVGFVDQREHALQFGDPNETDWSDVTYPATVPLNKTFSSTSGWTINGSSVHTGTQVGSVTVNSTDKYMYPSSYSTGTGWHGPSISKIITGETPPLGKNFNFAWKSKFDGTSQQTKEQFGGQEVILWNNNSGTRTLVAEMYFEKTTKDNNCKARLYVGDFSTSKVITLACKDIGACTMKKVGNKITATVGGQTISVANNSITDLIANEVTFHFTQNKSQTALGKNYVYNCKLQRLSFDNYEDVANIFMPGDVLTVNTQDAGVYLDDGSATISATYLGALGNDWEDFCLINGSNTIAVDYSDFTTSPPTFTMKYRERFI